MFLAACLLFADVDGMLAEKCTNGEDWRQLEPDAVVLPDVELVKGALLKNPDKCSDEEVKAVRFFYKVPLASLESKTMSQKEPLSHASLMEHLKETDWAHAMAYAFMLMEFFSATANIVNRFKLKKIEEAARELVTPESKKGTKGKSMTKANYVMMIQMYWDEVTLWNKIARMEDRDNDLAKQAKAAEKDPGKKKLIIVLEEKLEDRKAFFHAWDVLVGVCGDPNATSEAENRDSIEPEGVAKKRMIRADKQANAGFGLRISISDMLSATDPAKNWEKVASTAV